MYDHVYEKLRLEISFRIQIVKSQTIAFGENKRYEKERKTKKTFLQNMIFFLLNFCLEQIVGFSIILIR